MLVFHKSNGEYGVKSFKITYHFLFDGMEFYREREREEELNLLHALINCTFISRILILIKTMIIQLIKSCSISFPPNTPH